MYKVASVMSECPEAYVCIAFHAVAQISQCLHWVYPENYESISRGKWNMFLFKLGFQHSFKYGKLFRQSNSKFQRQKFTDENGTLSNMCVVCVCVIKTGLCCVEKILISIQKLIKKSLGNTRIIVRISLYTEKFPVVHSRKHSHSNICISFFQVQIQMLQIVFSPDVNGIF